MNIDNLLKYQTRDFEVYKLERQLKECESKKLLNKAIQIAKVSQQKSIQLEKQAGDLTNEFNNLKKLLEQNIAKLSVMSKTNYEDLTALDLENFQTALSDMASNISILENKFSYLAKSINIVLTDFEREKKAYHAAREEFAKNKEAFEKEEALVNPKIEELKKELAGLEKGLDKDIIAKYKAKRQDNKFPIFVPLMNIACGGCQMELSLSTIERFKEIPVIECEHCRRYIYKA